MLSANTRSIVAAALISAASLASMAISGPAMADATPSPQLTAVRQVVDEMGYTTKLSPTGGHFFIETDDKYDYSIDFAVSDDNSLLWIYTQVQSYTAPQMQRLPMLQLLEANDNSAEYFTLHNDAGAMSLFLQISVPMDAINPKTIHTIVDDFNGQINRQDTNWNPSLWK